jgi:hypothetical protein
VRARGVVAGGLAAAALAMVGAPPAMGASRTLTIDGWADRTLTFSGSRLLWTEAATVRVNPAKIAGSPRDAATFDYYRAETFAARLDRGSRRFRAGRPSAAVSVRTSIAAMRAGILAPAGSGGFIMVPRTARVAPPVIHCCGPDGVETVLESDGRAEAPVTIAATWDAGTASFVQVGPGGRQLLRRVDPTNPGAATTTPTDQPAVPGLVAVSNTGRAWVDPAAPTALQVHPSGATGPVAVALPGPALRVWAATNVIVVAVRVGGRITLLRVDQPALSPVRVWRGRTLPRVAVGGGSVAVAERRRVLAARRGSLKVLTRTKRTIEAVGVDRRRVAWIERGTRRKGGRVGVVRLGVAR